MSMDISVRPPDSFADVTRLFGPNGANSGCWCMWWRLSNSEWNATAKQGRHDALRSIVDSGGPAGLLGYTPDGSPVGWVAVAPRPEFPRLLRSKTLRLTDPDDPRIWSLNCLFIHRTRRRAGIGDALLAAAVTHAAEHGAAAVEGYPVAADGIRRSSGEMFTGTVGLFQRAGFRVYDRPVAGRRVVMRRDVG